MTRTKLWRRLRILAVGVVLGVPLACGDGDATRDDQGNGGNGPSPNGGNGPQIDPTTVGDRILDANGGINFDQWEYVARHYHERELLDYRLGPSWRDLNPGSKETLPTIFQPDPDGHWKAGLDRNLADKFCVTSDKLPKNEAEEKAIYDNGAGWIQSGQMLFSPDPDAPAESRAGSANMRSADGALAAKMTDGKLQTRALCMRLNASWNGDWWNRNNVSSPETPAVTSLKTADPTVALPPVGTSRGGVQASVTGFLAFQNGWITAAGTGNDAFNGVDNVKVPRVKLPEGMVPTAIAQTPMNEFVLVTVWNLKARKGQLAVLAAGVENQPANIQSNGSAGRIPWGVMSWPAVTALKYLGVIDLPMTAPMALSVSTSNQPGNLRGYGQWNDDNLNKQADRDAWYKRDWKTNDDNNGLKFRLLTSAGYAVISSRAENKVSFVDLKPLLAYYRQMYLTTQARWDETANAKQGDGDGQWPYRFTHAPEQMPKVVATVDVPKPTAVYAQKRAASTNCRSYYDLAHVQGNDGESTFQQGYRRAVVASIDGTVRFFDVRSLGDPTMTPTTPTLMESIKTGPNPTHIDAPLRGDGATDDLAITARGGRAVYIVSYKGDMLGVVRDERIQDPVATVFSPNQAGYGGAGSDFAVNARVLTILDYRGKAIHTLGMKLVVDPERPQAEQWNYVDKDGKPTLFNYGSATKVPGQPFAFTLDEVI